MTCKPPESYSDPKSVTELEEPLRSRIAQAIADAPTGGLILVSGYRTPYMQWLLRTQRCPGRECDPKCKGAPITALPGRSKHQQRKAADMGGRDLAWLIANHRKYGLARTVPSENWHYEAAGTPTVPIAPFGGHPKPKGKWVPFRAGDTEATIIARGGLDNQVAELQLRLSKLSKQWRRSNLDPGKIDGHYGAKSQAAVTSFKRSIQALQRMTDQEVWPNADANVGPTTIDMLRWWTA